ncbi:Hypothetical_protein [Hexamita inflata]|uniref:Hypothetical_protein n=1 Tax=Hexamita inflata TaxID=28002 RepID=A0AA86U4E2_9EUKA|nr:Hypothetical protein HINF_LOCUS27989 [Hexamita inflata]
MGYNGLKNNNQIKITKYDVNSESCYCSSCQINILICKIEKRTQGNQQFVTSPNKLSNLSHQVELVGSDEQKFEVFKILNNNVLNDVQGQIRPNNNPISFSPTNHYSLCSPFIKFVTYHVNSLMGKFSKQFWLALFRVIQVASLQLERTHQISTHKTSISLTLDNTQMSANLFDAMQFIKYFGGQQPNFITTSMEQKQCDEWCSEVSLTVNNCQYIQ